MSFLNALLGGALIGLSASLFLISTGQIAGISGMLNHATSVFGFRPRIHPSVPFVAGLFIAGAIAKSLQVPSTQALMPLGAWGLGSAGLLVGIGTRLASGCTSGHGVCGLSRFSTRSITATAIFMTTGFLTVAALHRLVGVQTGLP